MKNTLILIVLTLFVTGCSGDNAHYTGEQTKKENELPDNSDAVVDQPSNDGDTTADNGNDNDDQNNSDNDGDTTADNGNDNDDQNNSENDGDTTADNGNDNDDQNNSENDGDTTADNGNDNDDQNNSDNDGDTTADNGNDNDDHNNSENVFNEDSFKNTMIKNERIVFQPFLYKTVFPEEDSGVSTATTEKDTSLSLTRDDINVFTLVEENDFERVKDREIKPGKKYFAELTMESNIVDDEVSVCVKYQPKSKEVVSDSGKSKVMLKKKEIVTIIDEDIECSDAKVNGETVQEGIVEYYLNVPEDSELSAKVFSQLELKKSKDNNKDGDKDKNKEELVGTLIEFNATYTE